MKKLQFYFIRTTLLAILLQCIFSINAPAQAIFTAGVYSQDFGKTTDPGFPYATGGSWTDNSYYPGWYMYTNQGSYQGVINITNSAPNNAGGTYMYTINGGPGLLLGTRPSDNSVGGASTDTSNADGTVSPYGMALGLCLINNTGSTITNINVEYDWYQLSIAEDGGQDNENWFDYLQSASIPGLTDPGYTNVPAMNYIGPDVDGVAGSNQVAGLPGTVFTHFSNCINVTIPPNQYIMLRWWDPNDAHNDPHFAIDNIKVSAVEISATASPATIACAGTSTLTASGPCTSYTWAPATGLSATTGASVVANPTVTTTYTITGSLAGCSSTTQTVTVKVNPLPLTINLSGSDSICSGQSVNMTVSGATTYSWSPATGLNSVTDSVVTATAGGRQTYTVTGTNSAGCQGTDSVTITEDIPAVTAKATKDSICAGDPTTLTATGGTSYVWMPPANLSCGNCASTVATPTATTTYTVTVTDSHGCVGSNSVLITTVPSPVNVSITGTHDVCAGSNTVLTASGAAFYSWAPGGRTGPSDTVMPGSSTVYTVTASNGGCVATDTFAVNVNPTPVITITGGSNNVCQGTNVTLKATGGGTYLWSNGATSNSITVAATSSTSYSVVVTSGNGCTASKSQALNVVPAVNVTACCDTSVTAGASAVLNASGVVSYVWSPAVGNIGCYTCPSTIVTPGETTTYTVTGTDANGCRTMDSVTVTIECNDFTVPNVFTPNGDGQNDDFVINAYGLSSYSIEIYNRWGILMYKTDTPYAPWTGRDLSGNTVADGVYYYVIKSKCGNTEYDHHGFVQLIK